MSMASSDWGRLWSFAPMAFATPWKPLAAFGAVVAMMVLMLALDIAFFAAVISYRNPGILESNAAFDGLSQMEQYLPAIISGLIVQLTLICGLWLLAGRGVARPQTVLLLGPPKTSARVNALVVTGFIVATYVLAGLAFVIFPYDPDEVAPFMGTLVRSQYWWLLLAMLVVGAPLFEEMWFRGFLFPALANSRIGVAGAAMVSSGLWAAMHVGYPPQVLAVVFLIGLLLTGVLLRTGSLWLPIMCHAIYNGTSFIYFRWFAELPGA